MRRDSTPTVPPPNPPPAPAPPDQLPLSAQYAAAWSEHSTRIAQRQSVIQMYLAAAGVIYGYYFSKSASERAQMAAFFTAAITAITLGSSALMCMHNRVIMKLTEFMMKCEYRAAQSLKAQDRKINLFYFCDKEGYKIARFHEKQRRLHRTVLVLLLGATNGYAIFETWTSDWKTGISPIGSWVALAFCLLSMVFMVFDMFLVRLLPSD
jgi:hypothetical protein